MKAPKALLKIGTTTFTGKISTIMRDCGAAEVVVVAGAHFHEIREHFSNDNKLTIVFNEHSHEGQFSSLKKGLQQFHPSCEGVLVWPVDIPLVKKATVELLVERFRQKLAPVVIPTFDEKHGHPVIYSRQAVETVLKLSNQHTAKELRNIYIDETLFVPVNDPAILIDIDTPDDYQKLIG